MKTLKYIFIAALIFLVVKAFYLDQKIEEYKHEQNETAPQQEVSSTEASAQQTAAPAVAENEANHSVKSQNKPYYKEAPMEKVGDSIANTLDEKIKIPERQLPGTDTKAF